MKHLLLTTIAAVNDVVAISALVCGVLLLVLALVLREQLKKVYIKTIKDISYGWENFIYSGTFSTIYLIFFLSVLPCCVVLAAPEYFKNESDYFLPLVAYVILFFIPLIVIWRLAAKHRTKKIKEIADELKLTFYPEGNEDLIYDLSRGLITNEIVGEHNESLFAIYDNSYTVGSGNNSTTYSQSIIHFKCSKIHLPQFVLRPECFIDKILKDIDFPENVAFSKNHFLKGDDETQIRQLFNSHIINILENQRGISVYGKKNELQIFKDDVELEPEEPEEWKNFKDEGLKIFDAFKNSYLNINS